MTNQQIAVTDWWFSGQDFNTGIALYSKYGRNPVLNNLFPKGGERYKAKLKYELCKSVGLNWLNMQPRMLLALEMKNPIVSINPEGNNIIDDIDTIELIEAIEGCDNTPEGIESIPEGIDNIPEANIPETNDPGENRQYPPIVRRVIHEYSETYNHRSLLHKEMGSIPYENSIQNIAGRKKLLDEIKLATLRLDVLYEAKQNYIKANILPDGSLLWPEPVEQVETVKPGEPTKPTEAGKEGLPEDIEQLKKLKKNLQVANSKDGLRLKTQSLDSKSKPNPMPLGPKRQKIENRIVERNKQIELIDYKINNLAG
jgi:hypothetical protein